MSERTPIQTVSTPASARPTVAAPTRLVLRTVFSPEPRVRDQVYALTGSLSIGRLLEGGLNVNLEGDVRVSRRHATIVRKGGQVSAVDEGSTNGTFVDGERIKESKLDPQSIVRIGETLFVVDEVADIDAPEPEKLVGVSTSLRSLLIDADRAAPMDATVLLVGETGTGKELVAERIHTRSGRSGRYVTVNCAAIPETLAEAHFFGSKKGAFTGATQDNLGFFGEARGGTLFLDEVGELPVALQSKLLRVLENHEYVPVGGTGVVKSDARVVAATNAPLLTKVNAGTFRQDLFARLAGLVIRLPALRQRRCDIPILLQHFYKGMAGGAELACSADFLEKLLIYRWPMNVRELRSVVQRLVMTPALAMGADVSTILDPTGMGGEEPAEETPAARERPPKITEELLREMLARENGNVAHVADQIGKDRKQVYRLMTRFGLKAEDFR